ncbi:MAG TPA: neutral zinc metallopeptidase [Acidimicrobiales bacterium]|nr:neutral zinc metallopeptidase [Acidimicrobiales bacterium]
MRWDRGRGRSRNIEDRRGARAGGFGGLGGLGGMLPMGRAGGVGSIVILLLITFLGRGCLSGGGESSSGFDIGEILGQFQTGPGATGESPIDEATDPEADQVEFVSFVLDDVQGFWDGYFADAGEDYQEAELVLFREGVQTGGCGSASSASGPFYCPADQKAYIDLSFFRELTNRFGAPGDFAQAYVLAHEIGHHVQNLLDIDPERTNEGSVRLELQADCFAGVWAHSAFQRDLLSDGDIREGLEAAAAVGDDRLGIDDEENFTHGSADQRTRWLTVGYDSGSVQECDTFEVDESDL